jgi:hypothetical protein
MAGEWKGCIEMRERELIWETDALRWIYIYIYIYIKDNYSEHSLFSFLFNYFLKLYFEIVSIIIMVVFFKKNYFKIYLNNIFILKIPKYNLKQNKYFFKILLKSKQEIIFLSCTSIQTFNQTK